MDRGRHFWKQVLHATPEVTNKDGTIPDDEKQLVGMKGEALPEAGAAHRRDFARENRQMRGDVRRYALSRPCFLATVMMLCCGPLAASMEALIYEAGREWDVANAAQVVQGARKRFRVLEALQGIHEMTVASTILALFRDINCWQALGGAG